MDDGNREEGSLYFPSFRVWLCGTFRVERRVGSGYELVRTTEWGGSSYPRLLLKALLCCPGRQARRDALLDMLWPDAELEQAVQSLNTAVTRLRRVLAPSKGEASLLLTDEDSHVYRLAEQSFLWMDVDAALTRLGEAERRGRTSSEALPLLEEAESYLSKGMILQDEEGQWAAGRRATVEQARYRTRLWLSEAYAQQQMPGQAETILSLLLEEDPTDEDVLARLMLLLHRQGMTHKALRYYNEFIEAAQKEELEPAEAIKNLAAQLSASGRMYTSDTLTSPSAPTLLAGQRHDSLLDRVNSEEGQAQAEQLLSSPTEASKNISDSPFASFFQTQTPIDRKERDARSHRRFLEPSTSAADMTLPHSLVNLSDRDILERFSQALMKPLRLDQTTFQYVELATRQFWYNRQSAVLSSRDLYHPVQTHLKKMVVLLEKSLLPTERLHLCGLLSQTVQLLGELALDMGSYAHGRALHQAALIAALEAEDPFLTAVAWGRMSLACIYSQAIPDALDAVQKAQSLATKHTTPMVKAWLSAIEAEIQAHLLQPDLSLKALEDAENFDKQPLSPIEDYLIRFDCSLLGGYQGVCFRLLSHPDHEQSSSFLQKAQVALREAITTLDPLFLQRKPTLLADLAIVALEQRNIEEACDLIGQAATLATQFRLHKVIQRLIALREPLQSWKEVSSVQTLDAHLAFLSSWSSGQH